MRRVIVNSTPLIVLCNVGRLEILRTLYTEITIPEAVFAEVTKKEDSACQIVKNSLDWIRVERILSPSDKKMYQAKLHDGEVEVMILAQEGVRADLVILDDNAAKKTAKYLGIIPVIAPVLEEIKKNGFYISGTVERIVLDEAGES